MKFEESEVAKKARADFLAQRKELGGPMADLKQSALEESHKNAISKELHDRRVRIAGERLEAQKKAWSVPR